MQDSTLVGCGEVLYGSACCATVLFLLHALQQILVELVLGLAALVLAVLFLVHGKLKEFLVILTAVPAVLLHLLLKAREFVGVEYLRIVGIELKSFLFGNLHNLRGQLTGQLT